MSPSSVYEQARLAPSADNIRLLEISPQKDGALHCIFHIVPLANAPPFIALSYEWGSKTESRDIVLDGHHVTIRENLYNALGNMARRLWKFRKLLRRPVPLFWIDALCINQRDIDERNRQVRFMGKIYSSARFVLIWLGEHADGSERVMFEARWRKFIRTSPSPQHLISLLSRTYWRRLWIVQEVILARRISLLCGQSFIRWEHLRNYIDSYTDGLKKLPESIRKEVYSSPGADMFSAKESWIVKLARIDKVVLRWGHRECQDPRDKVFALLGITGTLIENLVADYNKTAEQLYQDVLLGTLCHNDALKTIRPLSAEEKLGFADKLLEILQVHREDPIVTEARREWMQRPIDPHSDYGSQRLFDPDEIHQWNMELAYDGAYRRGLDYLH